METIKLRLKGLAAYMPTSTVGIDVFHPLTEHLKTLTSQKKKTRDVQIEIRHTEWKMMMAQSFDEKDGPFIPGWNVVCAIRNAARATKRGKAIQRAVLPVNDRCPIKYDGPRTLEGLWAAGKKPGQLGGAGTFVDHRAVINKGSGGCVLRTRAVFPQWEIDCAIAYDSALIDEKELREIADSAGRYEGIGQYRPRFGKFEIVNGKS